MNDQLIALLLSILGMAIPAAVFAYAVRRNNKKDIAKNTKR